MQKDVGTDNSLFCSFFCSLHQGTHGFKLIVRITYCDDNDYSLFKMNL